MSDSWWRSTSLCEAGLLLCCFHLVIANWTLARVIIETIDALTNATSIRAAVINISAC
jgi:hypothetical protein